MRLHCAEAKHLRCEDRPDKSRTEPTAPLTPGPAALGQRRWPEFYNHGEPPPAELRETHDEAEADEYSCKISREDGRDCLRVTCVHMQRQPGGNRQFREWSNITAQCTEVLWNQVRPTLPTKKKTNAKEGTVVVLGEQLIPEKHKLILQRGPKFCFEPVLNRVEKLRISRSTVELKCPNHDSSRSLL
ncbi:hypothetical protein HPB47_018073 [Ixodes persulcatus]|uniref:Uncharacterized protein n=1 Tax=Ixodes persulcatus TaxID=34615 RepID=A0AC60QMG9_IXOPE|nr:hypothetical protein HPB47_018073 [Ixodes persulcatus]